MYILHLFNTDIILIYFIVIIHNCDYKISYCMTIDTFCIVVYIILNTRNKQCIYNTVDLTIFIINPSPRDDYKT